MTNLPNAYYAPAPQSKSASLTSFVCGLCSIAFGFTFILPIIGAIFGFIGLRREPAGRGFAIAGLILNIIMMLGWILLIALLLPFIWMAIAAGGELG